LLSPEPFSTRWQMVLDLSFLATALLDDQRFVGVRDVAYEYRRHTESQSAELTANAARFREELALFDEIADAADARGWAAAARTARAKRVVRLNLLYRATTDLLHGRNTAAREKLGLARSGNAQTPTA
jgi:hypothetical protein